MKLVVDENIPLAEAFFGGFGEVHYRPGRLMCNEDVKDADALFVRSVTQVNESLLKDSAVKFVGSATIGADHLDTGYLDAQGIPYTTAPGCNATAVVEYVASALMDIEAQKGQPLEGKTLGIVGLGNVGSRLKTAFEAWGLDVIAYDPPLEAQGHKGLVSFDDVLNADIVTLHTPLTRGGDHATFHMVNANTINRLKSDAVLLNASRGSVINNSELKRVLEDRSDLSVVLDVWEGEPLIDTELAQRVEIATPHIAGYSYDGKVKGTYMIYEAFCRSLAKDPDKDLDSLVPDEAALTLDLNEGGSVNTCRDLVRKVYKIAEDDMNLRSSLKHPKDHRIAAFDQLRKHYRLRREFGRVNLRGVERFVERADHGEITKLKALGFDLPSA